MSPARRPLAAAALLLAAAAAGCGDVQEGEITEVDDGPSYEEQMAAEGYDAENRPDPQR